MSMISLMMALSASERREVVVIDEGNATLNLPTSFPPAPVVMDDPPCLQERADEAAAKLEAAMLDFPNFYAPVKGRVVSQAKGPNRAQRRRR